MALPPAYSPPPATCSHVPRVRVPGIKWEATSRRVLTMEWIDGVKLTNEKGEGGVGPRAGWLRVELRLCPPPPLWCPVAYQPQAAAIPALATLRGSLAAGPLGACCGVYCVPAPLPTPAPRAAMAALGLDIVDFVTVGIECTLRQLLEAGFFHAGGPRGTWPASAPLMLGSECWV